MPSGIPNPFPPIRRIVTGHNEQGISVVQSDAPLAVVKVRREAASSVSLTLHVCSGGSCFRGKVSYSVDDSFNAGRR